MRFLAMYAINRHGRRLPAKECECIACDRRRGWFHTLIDLPSHIARTCGETSRLQPTESESCMARVVRATLPADVDLILRTRDGAHLSARGLLERARSKKVTKDPSVTVKRMRIMGSP